MDQGIDPIFEEGSYLEIGVTRSNPSLSGQDIGAAGNKTGNIAGSFSTYSLAYKRDFTDQLSGAIIINTPFGADLSYPAGRSLMLGGTNVSVNSGQLTGILRWQADNGVSIYGGARVSRADAEVELNGAAYGEVSGYHAVLDRSHAWGWLAGIAYEIPDYAARVSLTYNSPIRHNFRTTETGPVSDVPGGNPAPALDGNSHTRVKTPRSWNLAFQTGVAPDTLVFGMIRWVKWSEFRVDPQRFTAVTGNGLIDLDNSTTYTLGVARKFNDNWSGLISATWERQGNKLVTPLAPTAGRKSVTLAAIHQRDNMKITTGISYNWLGDAKAQTVDVPRADMRDNHAVSVGMRVGFSF